MDWSVENIMELTVGWIAEWIWILIGLGIVIFVGALFLSGIKTVQQQERWIIERFGKFKEVLQPGFHWIPPKIDTVRAIVSIWEQPVELFPEKPWIDFKGGGRAQLIEPNIWVKVKGAEEEKDEKVIRESTQKLIYDIANWRRAIRENTETCLRSYFNNSTVDETMETIYVEEKSWWDIIKESFPDLNTKIEGWGLEVTRITISDFRWSSEVEQIRAKIYEAERELKRIEFVVKTAGREAVVKAQKIGGVIVQIKKALTKGKKGYSEEEAKELAPQIFNFVKAAETGSLFLTRLGEAGLFGPFVADIAAILEEIKKKRRGISKE